jgi:prepilin-type N-terminal cleavage/methylation domain-containing protein
MKDTSHSKGFTLVELIISVAALSLVCALVLKLFLLCFELNQRSEIKQQAVLSAANIMETIKVIDTAKELEDSVFDITDDGLVSRVRVELDKDQSSPYGKYYSINVKVISEDKTVFELTGGKYFADR